MAYESDARQPGYSCYLPFLYAPRQFHAIGIYHRMRLCVRIALSAPLLAIHTFCLIYHYPQNSSLSIAICGLSTLDSLLPMLASELRSP